LSTAILKTACSFLVSHPELGEEDLFSCLLEENSDGHADFYLIRAVCPPTLLIMCGPSASSMIATTI